MKPLISFLMPTFGRAARQPAVIAEALHWFTAQTIASECELIILNTVADQTLSTMMPHVRIYNEKPIATLGDKMNRLVELARADVCCVYEDDDISLPNRACQALLMLRKHEFWKPGLYYYEEKGKPMRVDPSGVQHTASAYKRSALLGKYPSTSQGHDTIIQDWALKNLKCNPLRVEPRDISYVYRWGWSDYHVSAFWPRMEEAYANTPTGPKGAYMLAPRAQQDYDYAHRTIQGI